MIAGRHQFKVGAQVTRIKHVHGRRGVTQGPLDVHPGSRLRYQRPIQLSVHFQRQHRNRCRLPVAWNPSFYVTGHVAATNNLTFNLGLRYDLDNTTTTVNEFVDRTTPASSRGSAARRRCRSRWPTRTTSRRGSASCGCRPPTGKMTSRASFGLYYDQNHWNFTDIYLNETLLALRRINLNANSQANNPFWTPANTAIGIAQMRAFLAANYPGLSGSERPALSAGDHPRRRAGLQDSRTRSTTSVGIDARRRRRG